MRRTFSGGYTFHGFLGQPLDELVDLGVPRHVVIGLTDQEGMSFVPLVQKGQQVLAGQVVARGHGAITGVRVCSVSGSVEELRAANGSAGAIVIRSDGSPTWKPIEMAGPGAADGEPEVIERIISQSGVSGIPTRFEDAAIVATDVRDVIINGVSADIYNPSVSVIAGSRVKDLVSGVRLLSRIYPGAAFSLAVDDRAEQLCRHVLAEAPRGLLSVALLKPKFPQQKEEMLLPVILGRAFPYGRRAIDCGVLVLDIQGALAIHDAVVLGRPAIDRIVALSGPGFTRNNHVRARMGTVVSDIVDSRLSQPTGLRLVENSLLTGKQIADPAAAAIGPRTDNLIAVPEKKETGFLPFAGAGLRKDSYSFAFASRIFPAGKEVDTNLHGDERPCISCSFCDEVCPARILPSVLHKYVKTGMIDETLQRYRITSCIDCNLCTYVCPSKIDVASLLRRGKARLEITRIPVKEPAQ